MPQTPVFDLQQFLPYLLNLAAEDSSLSFQRLYKNRYGMLRTEWRVLFHLGIYGRMTARDIGQKARIHKTKISRAVGALEKRRFLQRTRSQTDRRQEDLSLTKAGIAAYLDLMNVAETYQAELLKGFTPDEVSALKQMLQRLSARADWCRQEGFRI